MLEGGIKNQNISDRKSFPNEEKENNSDTKKMKCECKFIKIIGANINREPGNNNNINKLKSFSLRGRLDKETSGLKRKIDGFDLNKILENQLNQLNQMDNLNSNYGQISNNNQNIVNKIKGLNINPNVGDNYRMKEIVEENILKNNNVISEVKETYSNIHTNSMKNVNMPFNNDIYKNKIKALNTDSQPLDSSLFIKTNESNENSEKFDYKNILNYLQMNTLLMKKIENLILKNTEASSLQLTKDDQNIEMVKRNNNIRFQNSLEDNNTDSMNQSLPYFHYLKRNEISKINSDKVQENTGVLNSNANNRQDPLKEFDYYHSDSSIRRNKDNFNQIKKLKTQQLQQNTKKSHSATSSFEEDSSLSNDLLQIVKNMDLKVNPSENNQFFKIDFSKYKELLK